MQNVGLMYCGAVLFINALMLIGKVDSKVAGVFNLFLGGIQIITPFYVIFTAGSDSWTIFNASGVFFVQFNLFICRDNQFKGIGYHRSRVVLIIGWHLWLLATAH